MSLLAAAVRIIVAFALFSSVSAMIMAGPRVYAKMADDGLLPEILCYRHGAPGVAVALQTLLAGFQFHRGDAVWPSMAVGAPLKLVREPNNSHDTSAVAVYFKKNKLGYVPRGENSAIAQMLDRGEQLAATISRLTIDEDPWQRVRFSVFLA